MGPPTALEEQEDDQDDGDDDSLEHAEEHDAGGGHQADDERGRTDPSEAPERTEVGERQGGGDDDRGQGGLGQVGEEPVEEQEQQDDQPRADHARQLGLGAGLVGHGRAGAADGHREALEEAGRDVRGADADHLLVRVHLVAPAGGEARRRGDGVRQRHQRDPTAPRRRGPTSDSFVHGSAGTGTPWGSVPTVFTPWRPGRARRRRS